MRNKIRTWRKSLRFEISLLQNLRSDYKIQFCYYMISRKILSLRRRIIIITIRVGYMSKIMRNLNYVAPGHVKP